jgi:hypothetical protein
MIVELIPFLTIVTRCHRGSALLKVNMESVDAQSDQDVQHLLLRDRASGYDLARANKSIPRNRAHVEGDWIYILDDDDYLIDDDFVGGLKEVVRLHDPHVVMVKALISRERREILPEPWGSGSPILCRVSTLNFVVRYDIWMEHIAHFGAPSAGDYHFISEVWKKKGLQIHWWNKVVAYAPRVGRDGPKRGSR